MQSNRSNNPLTGSARADLLQELYQRYSTSRSFSRKLHYFRKKILWIFLIEGAKFLKRALDIVFSVILLIVFSPLILIIAILIKFHDGGPILFVTDRVGKWGKEFKFPKFRSMELDAHQKKAALIDQNLFSYDIKFKIKNDPRTTWIGRIIRKTSLDELPQLWCILQGSMSLVGPRPPLPEEVLHYNLQQRRRLDVTPGLTCIWQVRGRSEIPFKEQVKLDIEYIESQSFWLDLKLLLQTIPAVFSGRGAY
jgi:lipopolysaccharide/colanic/teichoic acid biosynthesis glycosyltransferase